MAAATVEQHGVAAWRSSPVTASCRLAPNKNTSERTSERPRAISGAM
jgi:hypothetical protein